MRRFSLRDQVRLPAAIIPGQFDSRKVHPRGELIMNDQPGGSGLGIHRRALGCNAERVTKLESPKGEVQVMTGHVAKYALAKIPPTAPRFGQVIGMIGPRRRWPQPK